MNFYIACDITWDKPRTAKRVLFQSYSTSLGKQKEINRKRYTTSLHNFIRFSCFIFYRFSFLIYYCYIFPVQKLRAFIYYVCCIIFIVYKCNCEKKYKSVKHPNIYFVTCPPRRRLFIFQHIMGYTLIFLANDQEVAWFQPKAC